MDKERTIPNLCKRRGVVQGSITHLDKPLKNLEGAPDAPEVIENAEQLLTRMEVLDGDFKTLHPQIVDLIDEEAEELEQEQDILDKHDDDIATLSLRLKQLVSKSKSPVVAPDNGKMAPARKLACLECSLGITVSCQFILSHLTCLGNILLTYLWLIRAMVNLVELTFYSELMFSLMFSFRAGRQVLLTHL